MTIDIAHHYKLAGRVLTRARNKAMRAFYVAARQITLAVCGGTLGAAINVGAWAGYKIYKGSECLPAEFIAIGITSGIAAAVSAIAKNNTAHSFKNFAFAMLYGAASGLTRDMIQYHAIIAPLALPPLIGAIVGCAFQKSAPKNNLG